ncbi:K(+) efflux antiporter 2, chloroplastic-like [Salvia miltiorrhiza]|uniref:K(+) efflux antiporter 2, chloroplastic-like n=1 Tax=Salvia miltiorrhiza TaxID=226208 RepID=UPI0025AC9FCA|nr:K(+) efflux antiporter 2, chloroplastic-like [Salvia miltiorrhiza]
MIIAQLLSERLIPFVALDVNSDRVAYGRALDLPVYFGDAGSREFEVEREGVRDMNRDMLRWKARIVAIKALVFGGSS